MRRAADKVGVLWHAGSAEEEQLYLDILTKAFNDLGYVEGKNVVFLHRIPAERLEKFRSFASELVESKVAITPPGAAVLKQTTSTIPVVFSVVPDPVGSGLVASLAHPGGNLTGLSLMGSDLSGKRLSLVKKATPSLSSAALLVDRSLDSNTSQRNVSAYSKAAESMGLVLHVIECQALRQLSRLFQQLLQIAARGQLWPGRCSRTKGRGLGHQRWRSECPHYPYGLKRCASDC